MMNTLPYAFHDIEREIRFNRFDLPQPWINYLSNGRMHAFVSQAGGGMAWWLSPIAFRISRYRFYNMPIDSPGFYVYIRMEDGTVWSPTFRPCDTKVDMREAAHAPGFSTFTAKKDGLTATLKLFMAQDYDALLWDLKLKNENGEDITCDVYAYVELSQFLAKEENTLGYYLKWNTRAIFDEELQAITYAYTAWMHPRATESPLVYFGSSEKTDSYCCNRDSFCIRDLALQDIQMLVPPSAALAELLLHRTFFAKGCQGFFRLLNGIFIVGQRTLGDAEVVMGVFFLSGSDSQMAV